MKESVLEIQDVSMVFGGLRAVDHVDLTVFNGEIVALIGPNGAGKTTIFNCITGLYTPSSGKILFAPSHTMHKSANPDNLIKQSVNGKKPDKITRLGMARTFQNIRLFSSMTALENVMIGRHCRLASGIFGAVFRGKKVREEEERVIHDSMLILKKLGLESQADEIASSLAYGDQRLLEIARALATEPSLLLLDEPAAGMNQQETRELDETIKRIRDEEGLTIFLIEHDMSLVMSLSERIYVLDYGQLIAEGSPESVKKDPKVIKAYLGE